MISGVVSACHSFSGVMGAVGAIAMLARALR
jgi:hypothetical protein